MLTQTRRSFEFGTQFSSEPEGWRAACRHVVLGVRATMQDASFALNPSAAGGLAKLRECERGPGRFRRRRGVHRPRGVDKPCSPGESRPRPRGCSVDRSHGATCFLPGSTASGPRPTLPCATLLRSRTLSDPSASESLESALTVSKGRSAA